MQDFNTVEGVPVFWFQHQARGYSNIYRIHLRGTDNVALVNWSKAIEVGTGIYQGW